MASRTWQGPSGGAWTTAANWAGGSGVPTTSDDLTITNGFSGTINITSGNARHVYIEGGADVTFATGSSSLAINGDLLVNNGTLNTTGTSSNSIRFTGTAQDSNWTPGSGAYQRVQVEKNTRSCNINSSPNITAQFTFINGTINQNANMTAAIVSNSSANTRTWNMNGYNVNVTNTSGTPYGQGVGSCTFGGTRGYFIMASGAAANCGTTSASAPSISTQGFASVTISGHVWNLELNGVVAGSNTITLWNNFIDNATSNSTTTNLSLARSSSGTYTYSSYHQWNTILFGQLGSSLNPASTWNITASRANSITCGGTGFTYTLSDCTFSTNNTSGLLNFNCSSSTINLNDIYSSQGTGTQLQFSGSSNTINLANTPWWTQEINGSMSFSGANTLNVINDFSCRSVSISTTVNKTINFSNSWIIVNTRGNLAGSVGISDPAYLFTDMNSTTTTTGGFIIRNSVAGTNVFSTVARDHAIRVRWESTAGSISGNIRELIIQENCGFSAASTATLMVGDVVLEGTINVASLSNFLTIDLAHNFNYDLNFIDLYTTNNLIFNSVTVNLAYGGTLVDISCACNNLTLTAFSKSNITVNLNNVIVKNSAILNSGSSTFNVYQLYVFDTLTFSPSNSTLTLNGYDLECGTFSSTSSNTRTIIPNGRWIIVNDRISSINKLGKVDILDGTTLLSNWDTTGYKIRSTDLCRFGTTGISYIPNIRIETPLETRTPGVYELPSGLTGRVKNIHFASTATGTSGLSSTYTTNVYGDITGTLDTTSTYWVISIEGNCNFDASMNNYGSFLLQSVTVNGSGITVNFNTKLELRGSFNQTLGNSNINADFNAYSAATSFGHTAGTVTIASNKTVKTGSFFRSGTNSASLVLNGNLEIIYSLTGNARFNIPDTTNYTISGDGWVIYRAKAAFNYGGTNSSAINFTTGANTFNVKILQNLDINLLTLPAAKSFTNHEGTWDQMGRWSNTSTMTIYIFKDFSVYAPPNDDGTYRNKVGLLNPIFAGTDSNKIHNFGTIGINPGYGGMEPTFSGIRMASSGTLKCLNNVNCNGLPFKHSSGTLELTSSNITCSTIWFGSDGTNNSLDTGTRTWIFPAANTHIICTDFSHPTTTGLICSGTYYDSSDPTQISGIYINNTNVTTILSGNTANTSTSPNFILSNLATKLNTSFYCNSIRLYSDNVNSNSNIYVDNMWAPTNQSGSNIAWQNNINVYMTGIKNGYIDTTGNVSSCPITIVDPGVGNTKTVYTSTRISQTTRIGTITVNNRTILNGNPIPNSSTPNNVVIDGLLNLLGSLVIKSGQGWDFTGSGTVFSAASAQNITDNGGIFYFSNSAATQAIFPTTTINNITRNTTSTNTLTITSNNTTIGTIANHINGGGSFAFINGGLGAPIFNAFNINGTPNAISLITGPVISSGAIFLVEYATVTNSTANPSGNWLGGNGTTDGGGNINWLFGQGINNNDNFFLLIF